MQERRKEDKKDQAMEPSTEFKTNTPALVIGFALACAALLPCAQGVTPAPDGGYAGFNTAEGQNALFSRTTGLWNTGLGAFTLYRDTSGNGNTAVGINGLRNNVTGGFNTAVGLNTLYFNNGDPINGTGSENSALGAYALFHNTTGGDNTALGAFALSSSTGFQNTAIGDSALMNLNVGAGNVGVGESAGYNVTTANNVICIGAFVAGADVDNSCFIGNVREVATANANAIPVLIDSAGQLGTASSSRRFKKDIKSMGKASETILALEPVTFHYKNDKTNSPQFGLIAEKVAAVNPDLVVHDGNGEIYTVRYDAVNAMLLNEFLKEHKKVEAQNRRIAEQETSISKQEATITELKSIVAKHEQSVEALAAHVRKQDSKIQKVSAQVETSMPATRMVSR